MGLKIVRDDMVNKRLLLVFLMSMLPVGIAMAGPSEDLAGMMQALQSNLGPLYRFVVAISYVMGIWFISDSIMKLKKYGQARTMMSTNASMAKPIILMGIGVAMLYFPTFVNVSVASIWVNGSSSSVLKYPTGTSMWDAFVHPLIDTLRLFGLIAVVRGLAILTKLGNESVQPGTVGKGLMHIIAGTLAVNIVGTIGIIKATFGFS